MHADYWHELWQTNVLGFHRDSTNPLLMEHIGALALAPGARIFVPLCGKTLDIAWLLSQGYRVAGAELSPLAVSQLFEALGVEPEVSEAGAFRLFSYGDLQIFLGDVFDMSPELLGGVDAVYDRAAIVALPETMRTDYTKQILRLSKGAPQLLIHYEYDQTRMQGPPFSVSKTELMRHYGHCYRPELLHTTQLPALGGGCTRHEHVWVFR